MSEKVPQPCAETDALLTGIACGELEAPPVARAHLEACARCRTELDALARTARLAGVLSLEEPSAQLDGRILAAADAYLARTGPGVTRARARPTRTRRWASSFTALAGLAAVAAVTLVLVRHEGTPAIHRTASSPAAVPPASTAAAPTKGISLPAGVSPTATTMPQPPAAKAEAAGRGGSQATPVEEVQVEKHSARVVTAEKAKSERVDLLAERKLAEASQKKRRSRRTSHRLVAPVPPPSTLASGPKPEARAAKPSPPAPPRAAPPAVLDETAAGGGRGPPASNAALGGTAAPMATAAPVAQQSAPAAYAQDGVTASAPPAAAPMAAPAPVAASEAVGALSFESRAAPRAPAVGEQERSRMAIAQKLLDEGSYPAALEAFRVLVANAALASADRERALVGEVDALLALRRFDEAEGVARELVDRFPSRADVLARVRAERARAMAPPAAAVRARP